MNDLTYRPVEPTDYPLMAAWYRNPRVMAPVGFPTGLTKTVDQITSTVARHLAKPGAGWETIVSGGRPIGEFLYALEAPGVMTFDITIGEFDCQQLGLGTRVLREHLPAVAHKLGATRVAIEVDAHNAVALHVYAKVGFVKSNLPVAPWRDPAGQLHTAVGLVLAVTR
ncbi:GNAT family N-acetyltransferase [Lacticaseibacillus suihuaensis]